MGLRPQPPQELTPAHLAPLQRSQKGLMMKCQKGIWGLLETLISDMTLTSCQIYEYSAAIVASLIILLFLLLAIKTLTKESI